MSIKRIYGSTAGRSFLELCKPRLLPENHKGEYAKAYSARYPWVNQVDLKVVQDFIVKAGKITNTLQVSLDIFNIGNLLKDTWGISKVPVNSGRILKYEGLTADNVPTYSMYQSDGKLPTETFSYLKTAQTAGKFRSVYDIYSTNSFIFMEYCRGVFAKVLSAIFFLFLKHHEKTDSIYSAYFRADSSRHGEKQKSSHQDYGNHRHTR